jgi:hypothetical protein
VALTVLDRGPIFIGASEFDASVGHASGESIGTVSAVSNSGGIQYSLPDEDTTSPRIDIDQNTDLIRALKDLYFEPPNPVPDDAGFLAMLVPVQAKDANGEKANKVIAINPVANSDFQFTNSYLLKPGVLPGHVVAEGELKVDWAPQFVKFEIINEAGHRQLPPPNEIATIPAGAFEVVPGASFKPEKNRTYRFYVKVKDPARLSNQVNEYKIRVRAYHRTPEMVPGSFRSFGTDTVTVNRGDSTGNTVPSSGLNGDIELLGPKQVPKDIITGAGGNVAQIRTAIDSWIDGQIKLNDIYDASRPLYSGYEIYGATIRSSKSNRVTDSVTANTAGISGFAVVWNIEAKLNANGSFDFSGTKIKALTWFAVIENEDDSGDVDFTYEENKGEKIKVSGTYRTPFWSFSGPVLPTESVPQTKRAKRLAV